MTKLLFVCLGNICRSPAAEALFYHLLEKKGLLNEFHLDSAGTSAYHAGEPADRRMIEHAKRRGVKVPSISRQLVKSDLTKFDRIIVMDESNYQNTLKLDPQGEYASKVCKLTDYANGKFQGFDHVPDPYYGESDGFDLVLDLVENCCFNLLEELLAQKPF